MNSNGSTTCERSSDVKNTNIPSLEKVPNIIDSICADSSYKSVTDRYFSRRYCIDFKNEPDNDHLLLFHSNKICLITLAPSHPLFLENNFTIDYQVGNTDRMKNAVKGKGKKGGQHLQENSTLCKISCESGKMYNISSCIKGKLIEVNEALLSNPKLLKTHPDSDGYIAVVLSYINDSNSKKEELLTPEQYQEKLHDRVVPLIV